MSDFNDQLNAFLEEVWRREAAAIEECAERILLSGTARRGVSHRLLR